MPSARRGSLSPARDAGLPERRGAAFVRALLGLAAPFALAACAGTIIPPSATPGGKPAPARPRPPVTPAQPAPVVPGENALGVGLTPGPALSDLVRSGEQARRALAAFRISCPSLVRRTDGSIRLDAPGFAQGSGGGMNSFAQLAAMGAAMDKAGKDGKDGADSPNLPQLDGTFTFTTDAEVLANNTDEGPQPVPNGKKLEWNVTQRTTAAPTALVKLAN